MFGCMYVVHAEVGKYRTIDSKVDWIKVLKNSNIDMIQLTSDQIKILLPHVHIKYVETFVLDRRTVWTKHYVPKQFSVKNLKYYGSLCYVAVRSNAITAIEK